MILKSFFNILFVLLLFLVSLITFTVVFFFPFRSVYWVIEVIAFKLCFSSILFLFVSFLLREALSVFLSAWARYCCTLSALVCWRNYFSYFKWYSCWAKYSGMHVFPFYNLNIYCHSLLTCRVSVKKSADSFMRVHLYIMLSFSLLPLESSLQI